MKLLLDTHVFLWFINQDHRLSQKFREAIENPEHEIFVSVVSIWECVIKHQLGKLPFPESPAIYLPQQRSQHLMKSLVVDEASIAHLMNLPLLHRDPFDRLLICQALQHQLMMVTEDRAILDYPMVNALQ